MIQLQTYSITQPRPLYRAFDLVEFVAKGPRIHGAQRVDGFQCVLRTLCGMPSNDAWRQLRQNVIVYTVSLRQECRIAQRFAAQGIKMRCQVPTFANGM